MRLGRLLRVTWLVREWENGDSNPLLTGTTLASTLHGYLGKLMLVSLALNPSPPFSMEGASASLSLIPTELILDFFIHSKIPTL